MAVDWTKPIQFKNGEKCELIETKPEGWEDRVPRPDGTYPTRLIVRSSHMAAEAAYWHVHEDGITNWPEEQGYYIINIPEQ
jgi:hypothetical protein